MLMRYRLAAVETKPPHCGPAIPLLGFPPKIIIVFGLLSGPHRHKDRTDHRTSEAALRGMDRDAWSRAWRTSSDPLKGLGPLEPASLGKLSQGIKIVFAVGISPENLSGIVRWLFISLK